MQNFAHLRLADIYKTGGKEVEKRTMQRDLERSAGGAMVSVSDIARWTGRSRGWVREHVLRDIECVYTGRHKLYYSADVAQKLMAISQRN